MKGKILCCFLFIAVGLTNCKKPFVPDFTPPKTDYLVVGGFINTAPETVSVISLSHTHAIEDTLVNQQETNATVHIQANNGSLYSLSEMQPGLYATDTLNLDPNARYQLLITRASGEDFESEYVTSLNTPDIDSVTWKQQDDVTISVNTHENSGEAKFYRWEYVETWHYEATLKTIYGVKDNKIFKRDSTNQIQVCWRDQYSSDILVGTTSALESPVIDHQPLLTIPLKDPRLYFRYSILVKQYALQPDAYNYWKTIKENSASLGTLFDRQPSQLKGNIHSLSHPDDPVIGFLSASSASTSRIFIEHNELRNWEFDLLSGASCGLISIPQNADFLTWDYPDPDYAPWYYQSAGAILIARKTCLDCTLAGGVNHKPSFW